MSQSNAFIRVLLIEDNRIDADLVLHALRGLEPGVETRCVANERGVVAALNEFAPDIVLSDYSMPGFSGQDALYVVRRLAPDLPFIFVSGTIGEEVAIDALQRGAADYVLKENLKRLRPAIERALRAAREHRERQQIERALRASEERFRAIVETTEDWIWEMDVSGVLTYSNRSVAAILGYEASELLGHDGITHVHEDDQDEIRRQWSALVREGHGWRNRVLRWRHRDGGDRYLESNAHPLFDEAGVLVGFRGIDRDISLRRQQEAKLEKLTRIHAVLGGLGSAILRARDNDELMQAACRLAVEHGRFMAACLGVRTADDNLLLTGHYGDPRLVQQIAELGPIPLLAQPAPGSLSDRPSVLALVEARRVIVNDYLDPGVSANLRAEKLGVGARAQIALPIGDPPWGVLGLYADHAQTFDQEEIDLLERLTAEIDHARDFIAKSERLEYLAFHNPVTGLPNHADFGDRLRALLGRGPAVLGAIDIIRFRHINESRGRAFGDRLLTAIGERLQELLGPDGLFSHPSGSNYMFARPAPGPLADCLQAIEQMLRNCSERPFTVDGEQVFIHLRCGVACAPEHGQDVDELERHAVSALAEAVEQQQPLLPFSQAMDERAQRRIQLERELRVAIAENQFVLFLQPKFETKSRKLTGAEALLRWRHPERGLVSPAEFIPVLEETGLIIEAGRWVMRDALRLLDRWREQGMDGYRIAVNVSARELRHEDFVGNCQALLGHYEGEHGLDVEVTESLLMDDITQNIQVLNALRELGCKIGIDDFGTGYSSLNYLSRLPADQLKIDQSFTAQIANSPETLSLVTNIINLAHSLDLKVVAEGIEDEEQEKLLRLLRCDELQGYLLGRPMPADQFQETFLS